MPPALTRHHKNFYEIDPWLFLSFKYQIIIWLCKVAKLCLEYNDGFYFVPYNCNLHINFYSQHPIAQYLVVQELRKQVFVANEI